MIKFYKIFFLNFLILGTLISISSYSWMSMWMGLEINLLSMIPLMSNINNTYSSEASLKYFITQTLTSIILLFSIILISMNLEFIPQNFNNFLIILMNSALFTKMGAAPFHFWFPEIIEGLNWFNCFMILTWQKIAPMILIMYNLSPSFFIIIVIIISMMIGSIMGLNHTSLRKILVYSSISHIGWMLSAMFLNQMIWLVYFITYSLILLNIILMLNYFNSFFTYQLLNNLSHDKTLKLLFSFNLFSLGGLPPFLGFLPKWMTINNLINEKFYLLVLFMILFTLITLFFYLRISFNSLMLNYSENKNFNKNFNFYFILSLNFFTLSSLIFCTFLFNFI